MKQLTLLLLLSSGLIINSSATEIYRCLDEDGSIIYTQTPSAVCLEQVDLPPQHAITSGETAQAESEKATPADEEVTTAATSSLEEDCNIARQQLQLLNSKQPLRKPDQENPGKFVVLTDEMRQQKQAQMLAYIDKYCVKSEEE